MVPDNRDPDLAASAPDAAFWPQMRELEAAGAAIALDGYQHLCTNKGRSLVPLHSTSEFAGVPFEQQRAWIESGLAILRRHGLNPQVWVAPRHGFDRSTLRALGHVGLACLSDGLARMPLQRGGVLWIPQQLWSPLAKEKGLWTICVHPNTTGDREAAHLRDFISRRTEQFTSIESVVLDFADSAPSPWERIRASTLLWRLIVLWRLASRGLR